MFRALAAILVPIPMLAWADKPRHQSAFVSDNGQTFYRVGMLKNGFPADVAGKFHLQRVTLKGTLIEDELESMIEVVDGGVTALDVAGGVAMPVSDKGPVTLRGEIVDSKCHLGVMNPGRYI